MWEERIKGAWVYTSTNFQNLNAKRKKESKFWIKYLRTVGNHTKCNVHHDWEYKKTWKREIGRTIYNKC